MAMFVAGGTTGHPYPHDGVGSLVGEELDEHFVPKGLDGLRVAEEARDADQELSKRSFCLAWRGLKVPNVRAERLDLLNRHAPLDPAADGVPLVVGKVMPGL
jgi:hypothetical protein